MTHRCTPAALAALGALAMLTYLGSPTRASAAQPREAITVHYELRDLETDRGTRALYWRIVYAARMVCPPADPRNLWRLVQSRQCQRQAVEHAVATIGNPRLATLYAHILARHG